MAAKKKLSRDQKRTLKKAKRTPPPRGARTLLPPPSLLQPLHNAGWDNYAVLHNLPQTEKMSEVLWEFLAPYTPLAPDREAMEKLLAMAIAAWNVALFPGGERAQRLRELSTTLPAEARTDFLALIREMIARKERYFAQYTRYILNFSNNSPPPLIVTLTPLGYIAPRSKGTWYFPKVYGIIAKAVQCLSMCFNSLPYLHL